MIKSVNKPRDNEWVLVQDKQTGKIAACEKGYARELQSEDEKRIIAEKGDRNWEKLSKLKSDGKL